MDPSKSVFRVSIPTLVFSVACMLFFVAVLLPASIRWMIAGQQTVGQFIFGLFILGFLLVIFVFILTSKTVLTESELCVTYIFPLATIPLGYIKYVKKVLGFFPVYTIGFVDEQGEESMIPSLTVRNEREFLRRLKEAGPRIQFSRYLKKKLTVQETGMTTHRPTTP